MIIRSLGAAFPRQLRALSAMLLGIGLILLLSTLALSLTMFSQIRDLDSKVEVTEDIVDANVRTLSQVQRELLRLDVLLQHPNPPEEQLQLQSALVSQRVQEGTLSYQRQTLGAEDLLDKARALSVRWRAEGIPLMHEVRQGGPEGAVAATRLHGLIGELELGYNELVSSGEINRKLRAGEANGETKLMVARARWLLGGLVVTFFIMGLYFGLVGMFYRNFHRQRERDNIDLRTLNEELEKHAHVVRETDNMVIITNASGAIDWVNKSFERSTGYPLADAIGHRPGALLQGKDTDPATIELMHDAVAAGEGFVVEVLNYTRSGQPYWSGIETTPIRDRDGMLTGFVSVQRDTTEQRRRAELLVAAKETAEATARAKSNFLASMSHEIRTPLNAVLGFTDLLLTTELDDQQREYVHTAHNSGKLLRNLVDDILDFSALDTMQVQLESRVFHLRGVVEETVRMFSPETKRRGLSLSLEFGPSVPDYVWGDETRVRQVLVNLLGNAVKFTEEGGVRVAVGTELDETRPLVTVRVSDSGIGIPADQVRRLFQPFTQGDASTTRRFGGTGLGLTISRLLVDRMQGEIEVDSVIGKGSTFLLRLPLQAAQAPDPLVLSDADQPSVASLKVLVADDDAVNQTVIAQMLRRFGVEPDLVADGQSAVEAARSTPYDTVLMDVHMPGMDGVEAAAQIRAELGDAAPLIIAVTASALKGDRERLLGSGMDDYVSKPLQMDTLGQALERARSRLRSASTTPDATLAVDPDAFLAQTAIDDPDFLVQLVGKLVPQAEALSASASSLIIDRKLTEVRRRARTIRGAAASCAAPRLAAAAAGVEHACRQDDVEELNTALQQLSAETAAVRVWLDRQASGATTAG